MSALVLVADRDPFNLRLLQEVCEAAGHRVVTAAQGHDLLDVVARERPDLILADAGLEGLDGYEVARVLKSDPALSSIPILLVTPGEDVDARSRAIDAGADDYVTRPYLVFEVQQRIRNTLKAAGLARASVQPPRPSEPPAELGTGRQLAITLDYEYTRAVRYRHSLSCLVLRVANHDAIVHSAGERAARIVMRQLAEGLRTCCRGVDQLFSADDDELALLLPDTDAEGAGVVAERVRSYADGGALVPDPPEPPPRIELGWASWPSRDIDGGGALLRSAREQAGER